MPAPLTLAEYELLAQERMEPAVWDFVAGGAGEERTLAANLAAFHGLRLVPRVLAGAGQPVVEARILGRTWRAPVAVAPLAYHTLVDPDGEVAMARGAGGMPIVVSTFAGCTFEEIAAAASGPLWLQLYCFRDRAATRRLIDRAVRNGFEALVLTVDAPHLGRRLRDLRNGFRLPPGVEPVNLDRDDFASPSGHALAAFDPDLDWSVLDWLRAVSPLPIVLKGILAAADARRAIEAGADGIVVSNHGGRQLDGTPASVDVLPDVAAAVDGAIPVLFDGGVRRGVDVLAALALGADAVLLGRPVLYGLAVGGKEGVARVLDIVVTELVDAMRLAGVGSVAATRELAVTSAATGSPRTPS